MQRVCMNFSTMCNMNCDFCYNYFDGAKFNHAQCKKVIDRCVELGAEIVSIGGGDPFNCSNIWDVLLYLKSKALTVQIDTNGLNLNAKDLCRLGELADLISLPLDASTKELHTVMRNNETHFDKVMQLLGNISKHSYRFKTKVNTVLTKMNDKDILNIGELLQSYKIDLWSVYEYWPLGQAAVAHRKFQMEEIRTEEVFNELKNKKYKNNMYVELGRYKNRYKTYFFTTPQGIVYINSMDNSNEYLILGSIFDNKTIEKYDNFNISTMRNDISSRYNINIMNKNQMG